MPYAFDQKDEELKQARIVVRDQIEGPRIGDYLLFPTGQLERFSHDWGDSLQTSPSGSIYLGPEGWGSFSGGLNPATPKDMMRQTTATLRGVFWFFHHDFSGAGRAVYFDIPCRVFTTTAPYEGFLGKDFQSQDITQLKRTLSVQLGLEIPA